ncbi:MAG: 8-amino-7-oxononanoate synthase [Candidatus Omnitrophica bacterium]|nr:8-amino-7-oxononanoate synthase [Candidatus Omnitrophota bacterium]
MNDVLRAELDRIRDKGLYRTLRTVSSSQGREIVVDGKRVLNFCSNDYLGLASDQRLIEAAERAMGSFGFGAGASRLVCGNQAEHEFLEQELSVFKKTESALLFSSGYMANVGIISALCGREDVVFSDKLNHASITDGIVLSRAEHVRYPHHDIVFLEEALKKATGFRRRVIVTDTIFSMDGDRALLREIAALAEQYDAWLMVDEAHAFGVLGPSGAGLVEELGLGDKVHVQMGTLSKAAGSFGAYVAGSTELIEYLKNSARSFMFTTAMPAAVAAASREAIRIIHSEPERRARVLHYASLLREQLKALGFETLHSSTPIIPVMVGDSDKAVKFSRLLFDEGIFISAIRPPAVPDGKSRLRITVSAAHTGDDLVCCIAALKRVRDQVGV